MNASPLRTLVLGYGIRGRVYAAYADAHPDEFVIAGVADPVASFPPDARYPTWRSWEDALSSDVRADAAVIALPDRFHLPATLAALDRGLHVLVEKPIGCSWEECAAIRDRQASARRLVLTGYVLRYAPFYKRLREIVASGTIGEITSIHHLVAVSWGKAAHAFCRGNWSVEADGTGMLVNKCTHDFDLIEWWTKGRRCAKISSFGSLFHWRPECRPDGAADRCTECPASVRAKCPFDACRLYSDSRDLRYHFADESDEGIRRMIETSPYGRCVYACGNDSVDHQTVLMEYEGGMTVTLEMESYSRDRRRVTHFYGTRGEIVADETSIVVKPFIGEEKTIVPEQESFGHGGGDGAIMEAFARYIRSLPPDRYPKVLDVALQSHWLAFLAEASRRMGQTIDGKTGMPVR